MNKLEIAKEVVKSYINYARYGIFNSRNILNDPMDNIYFSTGLRIDICRDYEYFEVFGLTTNEFSELREYYYEILNNKRSENE